MGIRILLSIAIIKRWNIAKIDSKPAFLQSGNAVSDVYVISPRECKERLVYWLLLTADYGLVNASANRLEEINGSLSIFGIYNLFMYLNCFTS